MIKVRATQDGTYAGYLWQGPRITETGTIPGEVFELEEKPYVMKDEYGKPVQEMEPTGAVDERGQRLFRLAYVMQGDKPKKDAAGQPIPKIRMATFFSSEWMERVPDDTEVTYPDRVMPFPILAVYKDKPVKAGKTVALPADVAEIAGAQSVI